MSTTTTFGRPVLSLRNPPFPYKAVEERHLDAQMIDGKRYYLVEGSYFPSVTSVLSSLSKDGLQAWIDKVGVEKAEQIKNAAADRGTKLHQMCEDYLHNKPDYGKGMMPTIVALFKQVKPWLDEHVDFIYGNELALFSKTLYTAGRCDLIAQIDGKPAILDFKTSTNEKKEDWIESYFLQVTAYSIMFEEMYGIPIEDIHIFICTENGVAQHFKKVPEQYIQRTKQVFTEYYQKNSIKSITQRVDLFFTCLYNVYILMREVNMTLEYDPGYELYCRELEIQYYIESGELIEDVNRELQDIRIRELEELI